MIDKTARARQRTERPDSRSARRSAQCDARGRHRSARAERAAAACARWTMPSSRSWRSRFAPTASFSRFWCGARVTRYRIIAGERRWRAAQRAGLHRVPVVVRDVAEGSEKQLLELALVENIQRENLNPVDEALAYQRLAEEFGLTQEQIAAAVGKDRSSVANFMRLLKLPEEVRADLASGALSMGHARALLALADAAAQRHAAREVISRALSVRDTEALVKKLASAGPAPARVQQGAAPGPNPTCTHGPPRIGCGSPSARRSESSGAASGDIEIEFGSENELNRIYEHIVASK